MYIDHRTPDAFAHQYIELLEAINAGTFTADSYQEAGYQLIYEGDIPPGRDQLVATVSAANYGRAVSAFVVGASQNVSLVYLADGEARTLLDKFNATMGYSLPATEAVFMTME